MPDRFPIALAAALAALAPLGGTALAQTAADPKNVTAEDVVTQPLADINMKKDEIPPLLLAAQEQPYTLAGLSRCPAIGAEVARLDEVLGDDVDIAQEKSDGEKRGNSAGNIARSLIGSLIPFRGLIREVSGANEHERRWQMALYAGSVRRAFLKGVGHQKGCKYPARAATPADIQRVAAARQAAADRLQKASASEPVVQKTN